MTIDRSQSSYKILLDISRELADTLDLNQALEKVVSVAMRNVDAERGSLIVLDSIKKPITAALFYDNQFHDFTQEKLRDITREGLAGWVIKNQKTVIVENTQNDPRWFQTVVDNIVQDQPKSAICVPLMRKDELNGIITLVSAKPGYFKEEDLVLLEAIADIAGIAVHNATLYTSLNAAHQRYRDLFEYSIYPILITDPKGKILEANKQAMVAIGLDYGVLTRRNIQSLHSISKKEFLDHYAGICAEKTIVYESRLSRADGSVVPVEIHMQKIAFEGNEFVQWILRDLSERVELDQLREDLAAMIYHDLRAPLANISSSLEIMDSMLPAENASTVRSVFQIANRSAERMQRLISSLLDINLLESGKALTNIKSVDMSDLAKEAREIVQPNVETKKQTLTLSFPRKTPTIQGDADMLRRVIINLLENAIKFTPSNGAIAVGGKMEGRKLKIWVKDSGSGIPENMRSSIFEKFIRVKTEGTPRGVGLGLAFCRLAVEAHGGKIWVESNLGEGSKFIFTLPVE